MFKSAYLLESTERYLVLTAVIFVSWPHIQWPAACMSLYPPKRTQWIWRVWARFVCACASKSVVLSLAYKHLFGSFWLWVLHKDNHDRHPGAEKPGFCDLIMQCSHAGSPGVCTCVCFKIHLSQTKTIKLQSTSVKSCWHSNSDSWQMRVMHTLLTWIHLGGHSNEKFPVSWL